MVVGGFGYPRPGSGKCVSEKNRKPIMDHAECEAAAVIMGLDDVTASVQNSGNYGATGCYWNTLGTGLMYNSQYNSNACYSQDSDFCICLAAPDCVHTNGATSNSGPCFCGETESCTAASGLYCTSSTSTCSRGNPCVSVDASLLNTIACACGTAACNDLNGKYCLASLNTCSVLLGAECPVTDGTVPNRNPCKCGNIECSVSTGLICSSTVDGGDFCRKPLPDKIQGTDWLPLTDWLNPDTRSTIESIYGPISEWYTGQVSSMSQLFQNKATFNEDLSKWDVSRVITMSYSKFPFSRSPQKRFSFFLARQSNNFLAIQSNEIRRTNPIFCRSHTSYCALFMYTCTCICTRTVHVFHHFACGTVRYMYLYKYLTCPLFSVSMYFFFFEL